MLCEVVVLGIFYDLGYLYLWASESSLENIPDRDSQICKTRLDQG
jgi:hypothetical protein